MKGNERQKRYQCSFCGKDQNMVKQLIAGPKGIYICNECVALCNEILAKEQTPEKSPSR